MQTGLFVRTLDASSRLQVGQAARRWTHEWLRTERHNLHRHPELSGHEVKTRARIRAILTTRTPSAELRELPASGGLAAVFASTGAGPTTLLRCELDALPIQEETTVPYKSGVAGCAHLCGHDGHMAIMIGVASMVAARQVSSGRVVLLFQPAEETGQGAAAVVADPAFAALQPDHAFALHNLPGLPLGHVTLKNGCFTCASRGLIVRLCGKTSHAAHPEDGVSPGLTLCRLLPRLQTLPQALPFFSLVTPVGVRMGDQTFGTSPADATLMCTLRTTSDADMEILVSAAEAIVREEVAQGPKGLELTSLEYQDIFATCTNKDSGVALLQQACQDRGVPYTFRDIPYRWSEDFGALIASARLGGAFFTMGAGEAHPQLHNSDYNFPDALLDHAPPLLMALLERLGHFRV